MLILHQILILFTFDNVACFYLEKMVIKLQRINRSNSVLIIVTVKYDRKLKHNELFRQKPKMKDNQFKSF